MNPTKRAPHNSLRSILFRFVRLVVLSAAPELHIGERMLGKEPVDAPTKGQLPNTDNAADAVLNYFSNESMPS